MFRVFSLPVTPALFYLDFATFLSRRIFSLPVAPALFYLVSSRRILSLPVAPALFYLDFATFLHRVFTVLPAFFQAYSAISIHYYAGTF